MVEERRLEDHSRDKAYSILLEMKRLFITSSNDCERIQTSVIPKESFIHGV